MICSVSLFTSVEKKKAETVPSHFFCSSWRLGNRGDSNNSIIFNEKSQSDGLAFLRRLDLT